MPLIDVSITAGRSAEQVRGLITGLHKAAETALGIDSDKITIVVREVERAHWSRANITVAERDDAHSPTDTK